VILCADDFGIAPDVDDAILQLVAQRKLSAVSVMAALLEEPTPALRELLVHRDHLDVGLHLTLTDEPVAAPSPALDSLRRNGRFFTFRQLWSRCASDATRAEDISREIARQLQCFKELTGIAPDYVDGHLHVQQIPVVRRELIALVSAMPAADRPYVRNAHEPERAGIQTNDGFAGICDYHLWPTYADSLRRIFRHVRPGNYLIMAHPGLREDWRRAEFDGLLAAQFHDGEPRRFQRRAVAP
jgi:chitin disaccharide deacetylase